MGVYLKEGVYSYTDPWKSFIFVSSIQSCLQQIPYLANSSDELQHALSYSMETCTLPKNGFLFREGQTADKIWFLIEGRLRVLALIASKCFNWLLEKASHSTLNRAVSQHQPNRIGFAISRELSMLNDERKGLDKAQVTLKFETLQVGSLLCTSQALVASTFSISCRAAEPCTLLYLPIDKLEKLAIAKPQLKQQISLVKQKLMYRDSESGEIVRDVPVIDVFKSFADREKQAFWGNMLKFKNRVLAITLRKRTLHMFKISDIQGLSSSLTLSIQLMTRDTQSSLVRLRLERPTSKL